MRGDGMMGEKEGERGRGRRDDCMVWYVLCILIRYWLLQHTIYWCCRRRWDEYQVVMVGVDVECCWRNEKRNFAHKE